VTTTTASPQPSILPAIALRLASVVLFAVMNVLIKLAGARGAVLGELLFFRQFGAALLVGTVIAAGPGLASLRTQRIGAHVLRAVIGLTAMLLTFTTLLLLPLAEPTAIGFSMPIFATVLGALILAEPTGWWRWGAVLAGFVGVVIVTQPGSSHVALAGVLTGLGAAFCTAGVSILLRTIGRTEAALTTVFWFSALSLLPLGVAYLLSARAHDAATWAMLIGIGLVGGCGQMAMTASLKRGAVSLVVPMDYTALLWATAFGALVFGTLPTPATWIGAPLIVASGLAIVWREHRRRVGATQTAVLQE
jgi:drug/metabolite transporter (DMT)-like permease